jgi:ABC-type xylose transport system permease subunit
VDQALVAAVPVEDQDAGDAVRPQALTALPCLHLAGDFVQTGWPATMEGAVRSGYLAAEAIFAKLGVPAFVVSLAGLLGWKGAHLFILGADGTINIPRDGAIAMLTKTFFTPV